MELTYETTATEWFRFRRTEHSDHSFSILFHPILILHIPKSVKIAIAASTLPNCKSYTPRSASPAFVAYALQA